MNWDRVRPAAPRAHATSVDLSAEGRTLNISWDDGSITRVAARTLRQNCPCAGCVDESTRRRTLDVAAVPETLRALEIRTVGNYALSFTFSDAHQTGIFDWTLLRQIGVTGPV